jgi:hypothetical protein
MENNQRNNDRPYDHVHSQSPSQRSRQPHGSPHNDQQSSATVQERNITSIDHYGDLTSGALYQDFQPSYGFDDQHQGSADYLNMRQHSNSGIQVLRRDSPSTVRNQGGPSSRGRYPHPNLRCDEDAIDSNNCSTVLLQEGELEASHKDLFSAEPVIDKGTLSRRKLTKKSTPENSMNREKKNMLAKTDESLFHPWRFFSNVVTCCVPAYFLDKCGKVRGKAVQQAWREKVALCFISLLMCIGLAFLTYGFRRSVCIDDPRQFPVGQAFPQNNLVIQGNVYEVSGILAQHAALPVSAINTINTGGSDASAFFPSQSLNACKEIVNNSLLPLPCTSTDFPDVTSKCHDANAYAQLSKYWKGRVNYNWKDLSSTKNWTIYNNVVLDLNRYVSDGQSFFSSTIDGIEN